MRDRESKQRQTAYKKQGSTTLVSPGNLKQATSRRAFSSTTKPCRSTRPAAKETCTFASRRSSLFQSRNHSVWSGCSQLYNVLTGFYLMRLRCGCLLKSMTHHLAIAMLKLQGTCSFDLGVLSMHNKPHNHRPLFSSLRLVGDGTQVI